MCQLRHARRLTRLRHDSDGPAWGGLDVSCRPGQQSNLGAVRQTNAGKCRTDTEGAGVKRKPALDPHSQLAAISLRPPGIKPMGRQA
jgi:hypothetical protein